MLISFVLREMQIKLQQHTSTPLLKCLQSENPDSTGKAVEQQELSSFLVGMHNVTATLEDSLGVSYKAKHSLTIW
jgi:hypothetical protein